MQKLEMQFKKLDNFRVSESYKVVRSNLMFLGSTTKAILFTSCVECEGKSTVSWNVARSLAESGKRVVYIDADMRKSVMMQRFQVNSVVNGLSHYLSGKLSIKEVVYETNIKDLYLMPPGVFPTNPTELLGNFRMEALITALKKVFDYVIIDTPPVGAVIDAAVVAKRCDASLMVVSYDTTSRIEARKMIAQLKNANQNFLGVVLNKVRVNESSYYYKRYGSYYGKKDGSYGYY
jgi:capsular exopolysaccharide synthesis family protein